jgi:hypothetical protein
VRLVEDALAAVGVAASGPAATGVHPLVPHLTGIAANVAWQRGDLARAEAWGRRSVELAHAAGEPAAARFGHDGLANAASFRGDLAAATDHAGQMRLLSREAGDTEQEFRALWELALDAAYAGDAAAATRWEDEMAALAPKLGSATARAMLAYTRGEIRAERGDPGAAAHLTAAIAAADEADSRFVAGIARHTLLTSAARDGDAAAALPAFEPLLDHWHGFGMWTQVWIAVRALAATLSRLGRHREAATLLGALTASPRATNVYGTDSARIDAVRAAASSALGPDFDVAVAEGAALGDHEAVALARRITRT